VKLLFDQNLSRRLVTILATEFPDSAHVGPLGLDTAPDREIWDYAAEHGYVIASKDSDFRQLAFLHGPLTSSRQRLDEHHRRPPSPEFAGIDRFRPIGWTYRQHPTSPNCPPRLGALVAERHR